MKSCKLVMGLGRVGKDFGFFETDVAGLFGGFDNCGMGFDIFRWGLELCIRLFWDDDLD